MRTDTRHARTGPDILLVPLIENGAAMSAPLQTAPPATGRHHRTTTPRDRALRAVDLAGRLGTVVTLAALLVVAGAVGGLFDGTPATENATVTATFGR